MTEFGYFKGEGGKVWKLDLPLSDVLAEQVAKDLLVEVELPAEKPLTPKEKLQAEAAALGLDTDGTIPVLTDRIDTKVTELREQAKELGIDGETLSPVELLAAIDAKLAQ